MGHCLALWRGCPYTFPIVGGFCAPTVNPEKGCFRHVSNEYTVPGGPMLWARRECIEVSPCCVCCGAIGLECAETRRSRIMMAAMAMNLFLLPFYLFAALGISTDPQVLKATHWSYAEAFNATTGVRLTTYLGVNMRYDEVDCGAPEVVDPSSCTLFFESRGFDTHEDVMKRSMLWTDEDVCAFGSDADFLGISEEVDAMRKACEACAAVGYSETTLIMGVFSQFPTAATNCQRSTRFGDVNCQATMGVIRNMIGLIGTMASLHAWSTACYRNMPDNVFGFELEWYLGKGAVLLYIATLCKIIDLGAHCAVRVPRRGEIPQDCQSTADYMMLAYPEHRRSAPTHGIVPALSPAGKFVPVSEDIQAVDIAIEGNAASPSARAPTWIGRHVPDPPRGKPSFT